MSSNDHEFILRIFSHLKDEENYWANYSAKEPEGSFSGLTSWGKAEMARSLRYCFEEYLNA